MRDKKMGKIRLPSTDSLNITFDYSEGKDSTVMVVARRNKSNTHIINTTYNENAERLYKSLLSRR